MFPDLTINQIKTILLCMAADKNVSPTQIQNFFEIFLIGKPLPILGIRYPFLVRCNSNAYSSNAASDDVVFKNLGRCSYNPNCNNITLQRCNYETQQVFYAAVPARTNIVSADMTALLETTMNYVKDKNIKRWYFTLSKWNPNRLLNVFVLPFSKRACKRNGDFKTMQSEFDKILNQICGSDKNLYFYFKDFLEFMSNVFCKKNKKEIYYKISSAFFNAIIAFADKGKNHYFNFSPPKDYQIDGIIYPSANSKAEGMNICLKKEVIDNSNVEFEFAIMYAMQRSPNNQKSIYYSPASREAFPTLNGNLNWKHIW
jgi:hypothetical protein